MIGAVLACVVALAPMFGAIGFAVLGGWGLFEGVEGRSRCRRWIGWGALSVGCMGAVGCWLLGIANAAT